MAPPSSDGETVVRALPETAWGGDPPEFTGAPAAQEDGRCANKAGRSPHQKLHLGRGGSRGWTDTRRTAESRTSEDLDQPLPRPRWLTLLVIIAGVTVRLSHER